MIYGLIDRFQQYNLHFNYEMKCILFVSNLFNFFIIILAFCYIPRIPVDFHMY